jgi:glycosyltransferase involved in cell wall biosynthesis
MKILFVHQNFPGQFKGLATMLAADRRNEVVALRQGEGVPINGVRTIAYGLLHKPVPQTHSLLQETEAKILRAEAVAAMAMALRMDGFIPHVVIGHTGWGEPMLLKDVWPEAKFVDYFEYFYQADGQDFNFDPEFQDDRLSTRAKLKLKNLPNLLAMQEADVGITPTQWQRDTYPAWFRERIAVLHEGIDTDVFRPNPTSVVTIANKGVVLRAGDEVITFAARYLEPVRGFHQFMRALPKLLRAHPKAHFVVMGDPKAGYGPPPSNEQFATYKDQLLAEVGSELDPKRVHFVGRLPVEQYREMLQISKVHVYLTAPFLISWSVLEAMATGPLIVASDTTPVREFIDDKKHGLLFDFFDPNALAKAVGKALALGERERKTIQANARKRIVDAYASEKLTAQFIATIRSMVGPEKTAATKKAATKKAVGMKPANTQAVKKQAVNKQAGKPLADQKTAAKTIAKKAPATKAVPSKQKGKSTVAAQASKLKPSPGVKAVVKRVGGKTASKK